MDNAVRKFEWEKMFTMARKRRLMLASFWMIMWQKRKTGSSLGCHVWCDKSFTLKLQAWCMISRLNFQNKKRLQRGKNIFDLGSESCQTFQHFFPSDISISHVVRFELTFEKKPLKRISYLTTLLKSQQKRFNKNFNMKSEKEKIYREKLRICLVVFGFYESRNFTETFKLRLNKNWWS